jgi:PAS domain S-box-containing protein
MQRPYPSDTILESLPDGFQAFDREWRYVYLNRRAEQILARSREELLGKVCWQEYPEAVNSPFHQRYLEAMETGRTVVFEHFCPHENTWVEFSLHPYPGGLGAFTRDITGRKRAEEALRESEQHYHALFDQVLDAVVLADDSGRYVDANPAACEIFAMPCDQLIGKRIADFCPPGTGAQVKEAWRDFLQHGEQAGEFVLYRPDGAQRTLEYRAKGNVRPGVHLSVLRDITEKKQAEEWLQMRLRQQEAVAHLGVHALSGVSLSDLMGAATTVVAEALQVELCKVLRLLPGGEAFLPVAGFGWEGLYGRDKIPTGTASQGGYTLLTGDCVIVDDLRTETRFSGQPLLHDHGVVSGMSCIIPGAGSRPWGVVLAHTKTRRIFAHDDTHFLQSVANVLATAVERAEGEEAQARQARHTALRADVSAALAEGGSLQQMLQRCAQPLVEHLDAALARIWTLDIQENVLVLQASAGLYTHLNGSHAQVPVGQKKIGLIAQEKKPHFTNDVLTDERISEKEWARREGMVAFAGYPLLLEDRVVGVVALFARHTLEPDTLDALASAADALAQGVERKRVEQRLAQSEVYRRAFLRDVLAGVTEGKLRLCDNVADLPPRLPPIGEAILLTRQNLRAVRHQAMAAAALLRFDKDRSNDLLTAVGEIAMNAVVHAGGGTGQVGVDPESGTVQVWVEDTGGGIDMNRLPRATLERGFTTAPSNFGHGFWLSLRTASRIWLLTGPGGTTVVLEQDRAVPEPGWLGGAGRAREEAA